MKCAIAKVGFEKNKVSQGFEALARAQCLLRSKISLGKMALLSQVIVRGNFKLHLLWKFNLFCGEGLVTLIFVDLMESLEIFAQR